MASGPIFIILIIAVMYLLVFRPQQRRKQQQLRLHDSLAVGAEVMTAAGIFGTIDAIDGDVVQVRVAPGVTLRMARRAIVSVEEDENAALTAPEAESAPEPVDSEPR